MNGNFLQIGRHHCMKMINIKIYPSLFQHYEKLVIFRVVTTLDYLFKGKTLYKKKKTSLEPSKLKVFADHKFNVTLNRKFVFHIVEKFAGKGYNSSYQCFLISFPLQCIFFFFFFF